MAEDIKDVKIEDEDVKDDKSKEESVSKESKEVKEEKEVKEQKTFTQEQVNAMMAKEKRQGKSSAFRELGINPEDKKLINVLQSVLKQSTEVDDPATDSKVQQAEERVLVAETQVEALKQGVQPSYVDDLVTLIISKGNEDGLELNELVSEYKTKYPNWFKLTDEEKKEESAGTGSTLKGTGKEKKDLSTKGIGARLAAQRKTNKVNKSYWD